MFLKLLLIFVFLICIFFYLFRRRKFDIFAYFTLSSLVYFSPGISGEVSYSVGSRVIYEPIGEHCYPFYFCVLILSLLFGIIHEKIFEDKNFSRTNFKPQKIHSWAISFLTICLFYAVYQRFDMAIFLKFDKMLLLESLGNWYYFFCFSASVGLVSSYYYGSKICFLINLFALFIDFYIGFRYNLVMAVNSIFFLVVANNRKILIFSRWRLILFAFVFLFFVLSYKMFYYQIKERGFIEGIFNSNISAMEFAKGISLPEPVEIQGTLNEIVRKDFSNPPENFLSTIFSIIPFSSQFGIMPIDFNSLYQPRLFPMTMGGRGANIWAEFWATGGFLFFFINSLIFLIWLFCLNFFWRYAQNFYHELLPFLSILISYWAFYAHRSSLFYMIQITKAIIFIWIATSILTVVSRYFAKSRVLFDRSCKKYSCAAQYE